MNLPKPRIEVLAKILYEDDEVRSIFHEVVYHDGVEWISYGVYTANDDKHYKIIDWKYADECFSENTLY